jgi:hypothetical protein
MAQTVCPLVSAEDRARLEAIVADRNREVYPASTNVRRDQHYVPWPISAVAKVTAGDCSVLLLARAHLKDGNPDTKVCYKEPHYTSVWVEWNEWLTKSRTVSGVILDHMFGAQDPG